MNKQRVFKIVEKLNATVPKTTFNFSGIEITKYRFFFEKEDEDSIIYILLNFEDRETRNRAVYALRDITRNDYDKLISTYLTIIRNEESKEIRKAIIWCLQSFYSKKKIDILVKTLLNESNAEVRAICAVVINHIYEELLEEEEYKILALSLSKTIYKDSNKIVKHLSVKALYKYSNKIRKNRQIAEYLISSFRKISDDSLKFDIANILWKIGYSIDSIEFLDDMKQKNKLNENQLKIYDAILVNFKYEMELEKLFKKRESTNKDLERKIDKIEKILNRQIDDLESKIQPINELFERYNKELQKIWKKIPHNKSIFIMMPFRFNDVRYQNIRKAIKDAAKAKGFRAFLSNDKGRQRLRPGLWENLVVNMLSCKYGVAVLPSEEIPNPLDQHKLKIFSNPNVALEFGFMYAKGENNVLLLTNDVSKLPVDVQGFLVEKFDLNNPYDEIYTAINNWLSNFIDDNSVKEFSLTF